MQIPKLLCTVLIVTAPAFAQKQPHEFLKTIGGFTDGDLTKLDRDSVVSKTIDTGVDNELALLGAARVQGTIATFLEIYNDIETFESKLGTAKKLSDPPNMTDLQGLELPSGDIKSMKDCEIGDCGIKMGEPTLQELQTQIDWSAPDADQAVVRFLHERILDYANAYLRGGNSELAVYRNRKKPQYVAREFEALLANSPYVHQYRPELHAYLLDYPKATLDGASDFLYWSIINFGPKPTLRLNHVTIYPVADGPNGATVITSKQLYYSRYFDTGLELYTLLPDSEQPGEAFYVVTLNRYRTDLGGGLTGKVMRLGAEAGTKGAMEDTIEAAQAAVQAR